jgi:hypothetical protein
MNEISESSTAARVEIITGRSGRILHRKIRKIRKIFLPELLELPVIDLPDLAELPVNC